MAKKAVKTRKSSTSGIKLKKSSTGNSSFLRILGIIVAMVALFLIGKATFDKMAVNSKASVQEQCKDQLARLGDAKKDLAYLTHVGEDTSEAQDEYDDAYDAYLECKKLVQASASPTPYVFPKEKTVACGNITCHADETCVATNRKMANNGAECVPSRCITDGEINSSNSYCDPSGVLFHCAGFLGKGFGEFSCTTHGMACNDNGNGTASCKATEATSSDCRTTPSLCTGDYLCNQQTGRCFKSTNTGDLLDQKKEACTHTYTREGCGPTGDGVQTCTRSWNEEKGVCMNISCGVCAF